MRSAPDHRSPVELLSFGVVNLDKPPGPSAHQVADWTREAIADALGDVTDAETIDRVAHAGTLDPKVTGSLPLLLGDATRVAQVFDDSTKEYVTVLELHGPPPSDFEAILTEFEGEIYQKPPRKSAVKRRLRTREVFSIELLERDQRQALLRVRCEAGTYIRKLCHDIGLALGTGAHMGHLRRTRTGQFDDTTLVTMETLVDALAFWTEDGDDTRLSAVVGPAEQALTKLPRVSVAPSAAQQIAQGAPVYAPGVLGVEPAPDGGTEPAQGRLAVCLTPDESAVCLGRLVGSPDAETGTVVDLERVLL